MLDTSHSEGGAQKWTGAGNHRKEMEARAALDKRSDRKGTGLVGTGERQRAGQD